MSKFVERRSRRLHVTSGIDELLWDIVSRRIKKYALVNTPSGDRWIVKYRGQWY